MPQEMLNIMMNQVKNNNPQVAKEIEKILSGGKSPQEVVKDLMSNYSPYEKQKILNQAKSMGVPENILGLVQSMK